MLISFSTASVSCFSTSRRNDCVLKKTDTVLISDVSKGALKCQPKNPPSDDLVDGARPNEPPPPVPAKSDPIVSKRARRPIEKLGIALLSLSSICRERRQSRSSMAPRLPKGTVARIAQESGLAYVCSISDAYIRP